MEVAAYRIALESFTNIIKHAEANACQIKIRIENGSFAQADRLQPNVILMDLKMPGMNGIDATRRIHEIQPNIGVLVITMFNDDDSVFTAMRAGARGYQLKDADKDEVVRAIVAVERGEAIFSPAIAQRMMHYFSAPSASSKKNQPDEFAELTDRELEILDLIAQGHNNLVISNKLSLSIKTVQNYVSSILMKLQMADRSQAIVRAREAGLGETWIDSPFMCDRQEPTPVSTSDFHQPYNRVDGITLPAIQSSIVGEFLCHNFGLL